MVINMSTETVNILLILNCIFGLIGVIRFVLIVFGEGIHKHGKPLGNWNSFEKFGFFLLLIPFLLVIAVTPIVNLSLYVNDVFDNYEVEIALNYFKPYVVNMLYFLPVFLLLSLFYI